MNWFYKIKRLVVSFFSKPQTIKYPVDPVEESPKEVIGALWYPKAEVIKGMKPFGKYPEGYPDGAVVHTTDGRDESDQAAMSSFYWGADSGYAFFLILPSGKVVQSLPLNQWGKHAGTSKWPVVGSDVSRFLVGIEVACAGNLSNTNKSWFGKTYDASEVREVTKAHGCAPGRYKKMTQAQEDSLVELLVWLKKNNPKIFNVDWILGHHEVSGEKGLGYYRKVDPGGSLSMTMDQLRDRIKSLI
jgi:hypothetical protein